jgi:hypothetical protein
MNEQNDKSGPNTTLFYQQFMVIILSAELEVHRDLICQLMEKVNQAPDASKMVTQIPLMVDDRIDKMLAGMADIDANAAAAFSKLLEARKNQRKS